MTKKKVTTKKKKSVLDKIQKSLNKLETLSEKQSDLMFDINELIDDAQMDEDDNSYHLD
jgi:conjugal transfer/entry exclusion protein